MGKRVGVYGRLGKFPNRPRPRRRSRPRPLVSGLFRNLAFVGALDHAMMTGFLKRHRMLSALK